MTKNNNYELLILKNGRPMELYFVDFNSALAYVREEPLENIILRAQVFGTSREKQMEELVLSGLIEIRALKLEKIVGSYVMMEI